MNRRERHQQALRELLDRWCIDRPDRGNLIDEIIQLSNRFNPTPMTDDDCKDVHTDVSPLMGIVNAATERFDQQPEYCASVEARTELAAVETVGIVCPCGVRFQVSVLDPSRACPACAGAAIVQARTRTR